MADPARTAEQERTALRLRAITSALRQAYPAEPTKSFNADMAGLIAAIDKRERDEDYD